MVKRLRPDIVTMDVQMPRLDGFAATKRIMVEAPTPILITTSIDPRALSVSLEAVRVGALAVQAKPGDPSAPGFDEEARELVRQVKAMSQVKVVRHSRARTPARAPRCTRRTRSPVAALHGRPRGGGRHRRLHGRTGGPSPHPDPADRGLPAPHPRGSAHLARASGPGSRTGWTRRRRCGSSSRRTARRCGRRRSTWPCDDRHLCVSASRQDPPLRRPLRGGLPAFGHRALRVRGRRLRAGRSGGDPHGDGTGRRRRPPRHPARRAAGRSRSRRRRRSSTACRRRP